MLAFVFAVIDFADDIAHDVWIITKRDNVVHAFVMLDVGFQNAVENMIFRQAVAVFLVCAEFGGRRFVNRSARNDVAPGDIVAIFGQRIHRCFRHVGDDAQTARHVAVERGVADADFGFVAGGERQIAEFV